jgi:hypothetical protein
MHKLTSLLLYPQSVLLEALQPVMRSSWEVRGLAGPPNMLCWLSVSSTPHIFTCLICRESHIIWGTILQYTVCHYVLWRTGFHYIIIFIINIIFLLILTLRKSKLILFRLSLCQFSDWVPWLSRVVFQLSLERLWQPLIRSSIPHPVWTLMRTFWSEWTWAWWYPLN